jgi:molybdenum cofactor cytidylyltransferase
MISGIILASGFSKRMGYEKLLIKIENIPIIERVIKAALSSLLDEIILVYQNDILKKLSNKYNIISVYNEKAFEGISASVKKGIEKADDKTDGFLFIMGDMPFLDFYIIDDILNSHIQYPYDIIVPLYNKKRGNPVLFPSIFKENLLKIKGDTGGLSVILENKDKVRYIGFNNENIGFDIDTNENLEKANKIIDIIGNKFL